MKPEAKTTTEWVSIGGKWAFLVDGIPVTEGARVADLTNWSVVLSWEQIRALAEGMRPMTLAARTKSMIIDYTPLDHIEG